MKFSLPRNRTVSTGTTDEWLQKQNIDSQNSKKIVDHLHHIQLPTLEKKETINLFT